MLVLRAAQFIQVCRVVPDARSQDLEVEVLRTLIELIRDRVTDNRRRSRAAFSAGISPAGARTARVALAVVEVRAMAVAHSVGNPDVVVGTSVGIEPMERDVYRGAVRVRGDTVIVLMPGRRRRGLQPQGQPQRRRPRVSSGVVA